MNPIAAVQPLTPPGPEPDDFMQQMRHAAGLTCVVGGLFRPGGAGLDALRMAAAPGISRDVANDLVRSATARVAVHVRLNDGQGSLRQRPATTKPVWFGEAGVLTGVGAPAEGEPPERTCQLPGTGLRPPIYPP